MLNTTLHEEMNKKSFILPWNSFQISKIKNYTVRMLYQFNKRCKTDTQKSVDFASMFS